MIFLVGADLYEVFGRAILGEQSAQTSGGFGFLQESPTICVSVLVLVLASISLLVLSLPLLVLNLPLLGLFSVLVLVPESTQ